MQSVTLGPIWKVLITVFNRLVVDEQGCRRMSYGTMYSLRNDFQGYSGRSGPGIPQCIHCTDLARYPMHRPANSLSSTPMSSPEYTPELLTLPSNLTPSLAVEIIPHGLTLHRLYVQADGKTHDILLGPESPSDHAHKKYTNSIIGRYTNRLPADIPLSLPNGKTFTVPHNESPKVSLHGGPTGFDYLPWIPLALSDATLFTAAELAHLKDDNALTSRLWTLTSPDGDQGYPGTLRVEALVTLVPPSGDSDSTQSLGSIVLAYRAKIIDAAADDVTPVNLTQVSNNLFFSTYLY
jgi:hypothetical protein